MYLHQVCSALYLQGCFMSLVNLSKDDITLSVFTDPQQDAIIGWMLTETTFFIKCISQIESKYFTSVLNQSIFEVCKEFYSEYGRPPSIEETKGQFNLRNHQDFRKYHDAIDLCMTTKQQFGLDALSHNMTGWMRTVKFASCLHKTERLYNSRDFSGAILFLEKKTSEIRNTSFEDDEKVVFNDATSFFAEQSESLGDCLTIGHPVFDGLLREGAKIDKPDLKSRNPNAWTRGGLVKGDTTCILGPSNSGKTTTLTSIIIPNIIARKYVLYFTHEQKWEDIKTKLFMNVCRCTIEELRSPTPEIKRAMKVFGDLMAEYLVYIPWIKAGDMWVESVLNEITLQQEKLKAEKGQYFDMLVDDYPGKLKSKDMKGRSNWEELDYVYDQFVNAAMQWRTHAILPVQTNREGYKANRAGQNDGRVIDQADAAGSFGIMQKADNVITLNRSPKEQAEGYMRFYISKSRTQGAQTTFVTKTQFEKSVTHGHNLPYVELDASMNNDADAALNAVYMVMSNKSGGVLGGAKPGYPEPKPLKAPIPEGEVEIPVNPANNQKNKS